MIIKEVEYVDFNGNPQKENLYFNLTEVELLRLEASIASSGHGSLEEFAAELAANEKPDPEEVLRLFEQILLTSYGEKSPDGKRFIKTRELTDNFANSAAYSALVIEFFQDVSKLNAFVESVVSFTSKSLN